MNIKLRIKAISIILITFLIFIGLPLVFDLTSEHSTVKAAKTIIVDKGGGGNYTTIQAAIDNATTGDTIYVWAGTYYENVIVNKTVTMIGNGTTNTMIDGGGNDDVVYIKADWVNVSGFIITGSGSGSGDSGAELYYASNCEISNCNISNNYDGILLDSASKNTITNNTCSNNEGGIQLRFSSSNTFENNTMFSCGLFIYGNELQHWNTHTININNTQNGKPMYYWNNVNGGVIPSDAGQVILANCSNVIVENQYASNGSVGIELGFSNSNTVNNNTCDSNNNYGIYLYSSSNNTLANNSCNSNTKYGIYLVTSSWNIISNNSINSNNDDGIMVWSSSNLNTIENNSISNNGDGIEMWKSSSNMIVNNSIYLNKDKGIFLDSSSSNTIINNSVSNNSDSGIWLWGSNSNTIMNNSICLNNNYGIYLYSSLSNTIKNNTMFSCGLFIYGTQLQHWITHTIDINNTINGKPVHYWKNANGGIIPSGAGQIILANCINVTIENHNCSNGSLGITLGFSNNNIITNNICNFNNHNGIYSYSSIGNTFENNTFNSNADDGIYLFFSSGNILENNTSNSNDGNGIYLYSSLSNTFINNTCNSNQNDGIFIDHSSSNIVKNNTCNMNIDDGIYFYYSSSNTLKNNSCNMNIDDGIFLRASSNNNIIVNNICLKNDDGIFLRASSNNIIKNNTCFSNLGCGVHLYQESTNNVIENNTLYLKNTYGIKIASSQNNIFRGNKLIDNEFNFGIFSNSAQDFFQDINNSNTINGKPILYFINQENLSINNVDAGFIGLVNCINVTVSHINITHNGQGILIVNSANINITESSFKYNSFGIYFFSSPNNNITNNTINFNRDFGIYLFQSSNNIIKNNSIESNNDYGIYSYGSSNNFISNNSISSHWAGFYLLSSSNNNLIYHNNIINNKHNAIEDSSSNSWDNGLLDGGNYWSDYKGNDSNFDGIGDDPYVINKVSQDNYPFLDPICYTPEDKAYLHLYEIMDKYISFDVYTEKYAAGNHFLPTGWMGDAIDNADVTLTDNYTLDCHSGAECIRINYTAEGSLGYGWAGVYWQNPKDNWGTIPNAGFNLTGATKLTFWARGEKGGEKIKLGMGGIGRNAGSCSPVVRYPDSTSVVYKIITLTNRWEQYSIDLVGRNLNYIIGGFFWSTSKNDNPSGAIFHVDDIKYEVLCPKLRLLESFVSVEIESTILPGGTTFNVYTETNDPDNHFNPDNQFIHSGWMGDYSDITFTDNFTIQPYNGSSCIRINYSAEGSDGKNWSGIYWHDPVNNWGDRFGGYNLTNASNLTFWAKGENGGEIVEFKVGGITGQYPDSIQPAVSTGPIILNPTWEEYSIDLSNEDLSNVIGGFLFIVKREDNPSGATFYLDDIIFNGNFNNISWFTTQDSYMMDVATVYDNALAMLAFMARGTDDDWTRAKILADSFVYAQNNDVHFDDGRLRDMYYTSEFINSNILIGDLNKVRHWCSYDGVSTHTGNIAWAMISILTYYEKKGGDEYLEGALRMGEWIYNNTYNTSDYGGYTGGYGGWEPNQTKFSWKSTEHNIDVYIGFKRLYNATGNSTWLNRALHAKNFVEGMWNESGGYFWTGTTNNGTINKDVIPEDAQSWGLMALGNITKYGAGISWAENNLLFDPCPNCDRIKGFAFSNKSNGCWFEGTAQMSIAFQIKNEYNKTNDFINVLRYVQHFANNTNKKGIVATLIDNVSTGLEGIYNNDWVYNNRLHIGATAWYIFAEKGYNPFWDIYKNKSYTNTIPIITTSNIIKAIEDIYYSRDYNAYDPDVGDVLIWLLNTNATWLSINSTSGMLSGIPTNTDVGYYWVNVTVTDIVDDYDFHNFTLTVQNTNDPPIITTTDVTIAFENTFYYVDYNATDPDIGDVLTWSLNTNATWLTINSIIGMLSGTPLESDVGEYWVNVSVSDGNYGYAWSNFTLTIINVNDNPIITTNQIPKSATEDELYSVDFDATDVDPTGDTLTWHLTTNATWLEVNSTTGVLSGTPVNDDVGDYWVNVSIDDGNGGIAFINFTLNVKNVNDPPSIITTDLEKATEDEFYKVDYEGTDIDPTADTLTWALISNANWLEINSYTGILIGMPTNDYVGKYWVNVSVSDGNEGYDWSNFTLKVINVNDSPNIITDDDTITKADELYEVDYDATDDDLIHGDVLTWVLDTNARWLNLNTSTGILSGITNMTASYWVNVSVDDGNGGLDYHNFTLDVEEPPILNLAPKITTTDVIKAEVGKLYSLVYNATDDFTDLVNLTWTMTTNSTWLDFNATSRELFGTPGEADVGLWWVNITVVDDDAVPLMDWHRFFINVTKPTGPGPGDNHAPVLTNGKMSPASGDEDTQFTFSVYYYDEDGDPPEYIYVVIDGVEYEMKLEPGDNETDGEYIYVTKLPKGNHTYYFKAIDGELDAVSGDDTPTTPETAKTTPDIKEREEKDGKEAGTDWMLCLAIIVIIIIVIVIFVFVMMRCKRDVTSPEGGGNEEE